jgi:hypothetical protein
MQTFPIIMRNLECLQRFHVIAREILSKKNVFDFESPDSAISRFPMTLMKSMVSLHQGPKVSNGIGRLRRYYLSCFNPMVRLRRGDPSGC